MLAKLSNTIVAFKAKKAYGASGASLVRGRVPLATAGINPLASSRTVCERYFNLLKVGKANCVFFVNLVIVFHDI